MRVAVTGATGNVGTAVVRALAADPTVESVVGMARRRPALSVGKVSWQLADVSTDDLAGCFAGADAVVHLAWRIQPSRDETTTWEVNVGGTARVLDAVVAASVPAVVVASSVGAYVERLVDTFEARHPEVRVVRLRPGLVFQAAAGTEIRRYFAGPFLPSFLARPGNLRVFPTVAGVVVQVVHAADVADAYRLAATREVHGAFNIAADPPLDMAAMARVVEARTIPVPPRVARTALGLLWRARLQPTEPGWLDLALACPLMDASRARAELGWRPTCSGTDAFAEVLEGMGRGAGAATPPLAADGAAGRVREIRTGIGRR
jgi:UDP-glucose 4-epimerase